MLEAGVPFSVVSDIMGWSASTAVRMAKRTGTSDNGPAVRLWTSWRMRPFLTAEGKNGHSGGSPKPSRFSKCLKRWTEQ